MSNLQCVGRGEIHNISQQIRTSFWPALCYQSQYMGFLRRVSVSQLSILFLHLPGAFDCHAPNVSTCIRHDQCQALIRQRYTAVSCISNPRRMWDHKQAQHLVYRHEKTKQKNTKNITVTASTSKQKQNQKIWGQFSRNNSKKHLNFSDIFFWWGVLGGSSKLVSS